MTKSRVSVIIPAYNTAISLGRSIDSALSQTLAPGEVIVINDGSTDNTAQVAKSYASRITYIAQVNQGQGAARNAGLRVATGQFVAFLDSDDYWLPEFVQTCVRFLSEHEDAIAVSTGLLTKRLGRRDLVWPAVSSGASNNERLRPRVLESFFDFWGKHSHVRTGSNLIRRDVIEEAGYQRADLRISQDLEYWGYIATFGKWGFTPEVLWVGDSMSVAARVGWKARYERRWRHCPTVEDWEKRILPRLRQQDWPGFRVIRGRVAMSFAHVSALMGDERAALSITRTYGEDFPPGSISLFLRAGARGGKVGTKLCSLALRLREQLRGAAFSLCTLRMKQGGDPGC